MKMRSKILLGLGCMVILGCFASVAYLKWASGRSPAQPAAVVSAVGDTPTDATTVSSTTDQSVLPPLAKSTPPTPQATVGMRKYENKQFHFGLLFPNDLRATEYKENGGALTVTFVNADNSQSFEVYVTPYSEKQITADRFKLDEPSGTFLQPTDVMIDGVRGTMFFGKNAIMGDTREVWFIYPEQSRGVQSYLYEVTTYKELDTWLGQILQSWKFL